MGKLMNIPAYRQAQYLLVLQPHEDLRKPHPAAETNFSHPLPNTFAGRQATYYTGTVCNLANE